MLSYRRVCVRAVGVFGSSSSCDLHQNILNKYLSLSVIIINIHDLSPL